MPIVCEDLGLVFFHNPRTGGRTITRWLMAHWGGVAIGDKHSTQADSRYLIRMAVVRDPVDRFTSWFELKNRRQDYRLTVDTVLAKVERGAYPSFIPQMRFVKESGATHIMQFCGFDGVAALPCFTKVIPIVDRFGVPTKKHVELTDEQRARVLRWDA